MPENNLEKELQAKNGRCTLLHMNERKTVLVDTGLHKKVKIFAASADKTTGVAEVFSEGAKLFMQLSGAKSIDVYYDAAGGGVVKKKSIVLSK